MICACACLGPMYGEIYCICQMEARGLPLNEPARDIERQRSETQMKLLFVKGGMFYKEQPNE